MQNLGLMEEGVRCVCVYIYIRIYIYIYWMKGSGKRIEHQMQKATEIEMDAGVLQAGFMVVM